MEQTGIPVMHRKCTVIGGGPAGLAAAIAACHAGIAAEDILILERDRLLGGILNQCIHTGFGLHTFGEELSGPEYAGRYIDELIQLGIPYETDTMVLSVTPQKEIVFLSPHLGYCRLQSDSVILAMGCRERTRGALNIPGTRPAGIYTAGTAQKYVNIEGFLPGRRVVILGSGDIGLIMARRLTLEGAKVLRVCELMPYSNGLARNIAQCLNDFDIPLLLSHTVTKILGRERVEGVVISEVGPDRMPIPGTEEEISCDTLLLSVGLLPENELTRGIGVEFDRVTGGALVDQGCETEVDGIFACGNVLHVHDLVDYVSEEAEKAGKAAAAYVNDIRKAPRDFCHVNPGEHVRYLVPQTIDRTRPLPDDFCFLFRVDDNYRNVHIVLTVDGEEVAKQRRVSTAPSEMERFAVSSSISERILKASTVSVSLDGERKN